MIAQDQHAAIAQIFDQALAFIVVFGDTFEIVITHLGECGQRHLRQRQQTILL